METGIQINNSQIATLNRQSTIQLIECLANNNTPDLINIESDLTIATAMDGVSLTKLSRLIEKKNVVKAVTYLTVRLAENFNVGKKFTIDQASIMAMDLFEILGHETLEDILLMFKMARQGKIGDGKDFKLDSQTVFHKWVPAYLELKAIEREKQHNQRKGESSINNFNWTKEDLEKFQVSDKRESLTVIPRGLGARKREEFGTPELHINEHPRELILQNLKNAAARCSDAQLESALNAADNRDAINAITDEIEARKKLKSGATL